MNHLGTTILETDRLLLRPFAAADAPAMYRSWASDPEVTKFLTWPAHNSLSVSEMVLKDWVSHYGENTYYQWAIVEKNLGEPIGSISVVDQKEAVSALEVGYCIGKAWWHRGYTSEALGTVVEFLITQVGANRVSARHDPRNANSGKVMEKCGMRYEGTLRQADRNNQGICDMCVYAILAEEFYGRRP